PVTTGRSHLIPHDPRGRVTSSLGALAQSPTSPPDPPKGRRTHSKVWRICHPGGSPSRILTNFCVKWMQASVMLFGLPDATHEVGTRLMRAVSAQRATVSPFT